MATTIETKRIATYSDNPNFNFGFSVGQIIDVSYFAIQKGQVLENGKPVTNENTGEEVFIPIWNCNGVNLPLHRLFVIKENNTKRVTKLAQKRPDILQLPKRKMEDEIRKIKKLVITELITDLTTGRHYYDFDIAE